jgi:hypothetical protein
MAKTLQFRRGTTDQLSSVTGAEGELFVDLDKDVVVVMDGVTAGGHALQSELVSSTNIKTVNGNSLLGSGDIDLSTNLTLTNNNLEYTNIDGTVQTIDLSPYLDDTTNSIISGVLNGNEITFTREDSTTFTVDVTNLYDDTNLVTSVNGQTGEVVIDTTNWDTAYSWGDHAVEGYLKSNIDGSVNITKTESQYASSFTNAFYKSDESVRLSLPDEFVDFTHTSGGFSPTTNNFIQAITTYDEVEIQFLAETNIQTGSVEQLKYFWLNDSLALDNLAGTTGYYNNGYTYITNSAAYQNLNLDTNGNLVFGIEPSFVSATYDYLYLVNVNPSTFNIESQYKTSITDVYVFTIVGEDGYTYICRTNGYGNAGTTIITKVDTTNGSVLAELSIPYTTANDGSIRVDSLGNIYVCFKTDGGPTGAEYNAVGPFMAKYTWNGTAYDNVWQKVFDVESDNQFIFNIHLSSQAFYVLTAENLYSINLTDGSLNWGLDLNPSLLDLSDLGIEIRLDGGNSSYTSSFTIGASEKIYVRHFINGTGDFGLEYPDFRYMLISEFDSSGNILNSLLLESPYAGGGYGEWYAEQHSIYWNENKLIIPTLSSFDTETGQYYNYLEGYSAAYSYLENIILDTSNFASNVGVSGKLGTFKIIDTGTSVYSTTASTKTFSDDTRSHTSPTSAVTISATTDILLLDQSSVTIPQYLFDTKVSKYQTDTSILSLESVPPSTLDLENVAFNSFLAGSASIETLYLGSEIHPLASNQPRLRAADNEITIDNIDGIESTLFTVRLTGVSIGQSTDTSSPSYSVRIGRDAKSSNYSTIIGYDAGADTIGTTATAIGYRSGGDIIGVTGSNNTSVGAYSGGRSGGSNNISIGVYSAGRVDHTGDNQITIGNISQPDPTASTCLAIGHHTSGTFNGPDSYWLTGDSSFNVNIPQKLTVGSFETPEVLLGSDSAVSTRVTAVASITPTAIETFAIATYRSAKLQIQVTQGSNYQISDLIVIHDGTTASINENISLSTGSLICTFAVEITGGNLIVNTVMNTADAATVKVVSTKVTV